MLRSFFSSHSSYQKIDCDRVQVLMGNKSKPKSKIHEFAFTGMIHCGMCGCYVTAEEKTKHYKTTGNVGRYTYYRCTRRKKREVECHEQAITKDELEGQVAKEILKFTIDPEFRDFALSKLRRSNEPKSRRVPRPAPCSKQPTMRPNSNSIT